MKVLTSLLQVLSFLVIVESSSVPNCSTVKLTTNSDDVLSSGFNGFGSVGEGWDGSPQTNVTHSCESSSINVRGKYSSLILPYASTFHRSTGNDDEGPFSTSTVCSDDNHVIVGGENYQIMDYVKSWGDECMGDYTKC
jgi:hypothetical protein